MQSTLAEVQGHLQSFDFARTSSATTSNLAGAVAELHGRDVHALPISKLPTELLLLLANLLQVPRACVGDEEDLEAADILKKERFQSQAPSLLALSLSLVQLLPTPAQPSAEELVLRSKLLLTFGRFTQLEQSESFTPSSSARVSAEICALLLSGTTRRPLLRHTLSKTFPPLFKAHPKLNPETGRVLSRPVGGDNAMTSWYEEGDEDERSWRLQPGLGNVVHAVVSALEKNEAEDLWPLLLPPLLAYLDDYHPPNKLIGTSILEALLPRVDASLLVRTGVGKVFEQSLAASFSSLSSPLSPSLILSTHRVSLALLNLLYPLTLSDPTPNRFNALVALLLGGIVHIWEFKSGEVALELVAARALPPVLRELGTGTVRFLNVLVPHLCDVLGGTKLGSEEAGELLLATAEALDVTLEQSAARVVRWRGRVMGAIGKCWTGLREGEEGREWRAEHRGEVERVEEALRGVLCRVASSGDLDKLRSLDPLFAELAVTASPQVVVSG